MWSAFLVGLLAYTLQIGLIITPEMFGLLAEYEAGPQHRQSGPRL